MFLLKSFEQKSSEYPTIMKIGKFEKVNAITVLGDENVGYMWPER